MTIADFSAAKAAAQEEKGICKAMRLPQFLSEIDILTQKMAKESLEKFIHDLARVCPETERGKFQDLLKTFCLEPKKAQQAGDDGYKSLREEIDVLLQKLKLIGDGKQVLDSEYNEEWDDWYHSDEDEVFFYDPQGLLEDIEQAIRTIHRSIDMEAYRDGLKLAEAIAVLDVSVNGDYNDYGDFLRLPNLFEEKLLAGNYQNLVNECLYLVYMGNDLKDRPDELLRMIRNLDAYPVRLENLLSLGSKELPEFDAFLPLWVERLGNQKGKLADELLQEAVAMIGDNACLLENARKYADVHPNLYLQLLERNLKTQEDPYMLEVGMEALARIPAKYRMRAKVALLTAGYAERVGETAQKERCWLEAFRSDTTVVNYLRLRFETRNWQQYREEAREIIETQRQTMGQHQAYSVWESEAFCENELTSHAYCTMLFFEQDFEKMKEVGMDQKKSLGWSSTFMKEGIALMLLLLHAGDGFTEGLHAMKYWAVSACQLQKGRYDFETDCYVQEEEHEIDEEVFWEFFSKWKKEVTLTSEQKEKWLRRIDTWINDRVQAIMENNRRNYYDECASFIAALGEVLESNGETNAKTKLFTKYRASYSRRRRFVDALCSYGMVK